MCGLVGFFNGCNLDVACPKKALNKCPSQSKQDSTRTFKNWDRKASVRSTPQRTEHFGDLLFPRELVPLLHSKKLVGLPKRDEENLRRSALFRFMNFTHKLEMLVVNTVTANIVMQRYNFSLPDQLRSDAHKIYVDEAYHALVAFETMNAMRVRGPKSLFRECVPNFLKQLELQINKEPVGRRKALIELFFVITSEMLITNTLGNVNKHKEMDESIRSIIRDHSADEARHHAFYRSLLIEVWDQLSGDDQIYVTGKLPELVLAYCIPEQEGLAADLVSLGLSKSESDVIIDEVHPPGTTLAYAMQVGSAVFTLINELSDSHSSDRLNESLAGMPKV